MKAEKIRNILTVVLLCALIAAVPVFNAITPDRDVSKTERRHLADMPEIKFDTVFDGSAFSDTEKYLLDNFFIRDPIRTMTAAVRFSVLRQSDNGGIFIVDGSAAKLNYKFNEESVEKAAAKLNEIYEKYLTGTDCAAYYSIIPDKSIFMAGSAGYPTYKYKDFERVLTENVANMNFIPIADCLDASDYYSTDSHWRQELIGDVVRKLGTAMRFKVPYDESTYTPTTFSPFRGVYFGQSALPLSAEDLVCMSSATIESATVFNYETNETSRVYEAADFENVDPYDVFLSGAAALLDIENPNAVTDRRLIIFRDSFGSSLTPLLIEQYAKITLVDIRYIVTDYVGEFVDFSGDCDVLFIYSTSVLNSSGILR